MALMRSLSSLLPARVILMVAKMYSMYCSCDLGASTVETPEHGRLGKSVKHLVTSLLCPYKVGHDAADEDEIFSLLCPTHRSSHLRSKSFIMGFALKEDRPTPREVYNFRTYLFAFMASFGSVEFGYDAGFIGENNLLIDYFHLTVLQDRPSL
jgi:hypothetical protein